MLLRLQVDGFKNLVGVDIRFGPFTCIAGGNGVGKSNVLDVLQFLSAFATTSLSEAFASLRSGGSPPSSVDAVFFQSAPAAALTIIADVLMPQVGRDILGAPVQASNPLLRYTLHVQLLATQQPVILTESLRTLTPAESLEDLAGFDLLGHLAQTQPQEPAYFITSEHGAGSRQLIGDSLGLNRTFVTEHPTKSMLSVTEPLLFPTVYLFQSEMASWKMYHLEPQALRYPDDLSGEITQLATNGAHLTATLASVIRQGGSPNAQDERLMQIARQLDQLTGDVRSIGIDVDALRNVQSLYIEDRMGRKLSSRAISDGLLRFLAFTVLAFDERPGVFGIEEPENGLHPENIPTMIDLLHTIAFDPHFAVGLDNPLRQVIVTTHAPVVVSHIPDGSLLYAEKVRRKILQADGTRPYVQIPAFRWLKGTWRSQVDPNPRHAVARGKLYSYVGSLSTDDADYRSVLQNPDIQEMLSFQRTPLTEG